MNKEKTKAVYMFIEDGVIMSTLYITEEQAAVFKWLGERGHEIDVRRIDEKSPEEIVADEYNFER